MMRLMATFLGGVLVGVWGLGVEQMTRFTAEGPANVRCTLYTVGAVWLPYEMLSEDAKDTVMRDVMGVCGGREP